MRIRAFRPDELQERDGVLDGAGRRRDLKFGGAGAKALAKFILARNRWHCEHWPKIKPKSKEGRANAWIFLKIAESASGSFGVLERTEEGAWGR